jgi:cytosine/adenosine deaminase-related metal-dependent hydrolase
MRLRITAANGAVGVEAGCIVAATGAFDRHITIPDGFIHPGLINAHDHLHRNHFGRLGTGPYANSYDWAHDIQRHHRDLIMAGRKLPRRTALLVGAWKNLLSGVTTVVHHDPWEPDFERDFPLRVMRLASADSLGMTDGLAFPSQGPFALHLAEGIDTRAAEEVHTLATHGLLESRLLAVHMVGADAEGVARMRESAGAVVWCPTSNHFLFGRTAPGALLAEGMDVLLGTDSLLTGTGDLLDELRAARSIGHLSDARLTDAVGATAARRLALSPPSLEPGARADLIVLRRPLLEASAADIALVMTAGKLRVLDPALLDGAGATGGQLLHSGNTVRWISEAAALPVSPPVSAAGCHRV